MARIAWNTEVDAPGCPGEIVADDGRTILVQTDWECPQTARGFGWSLREVQCCGACGKVFRCDGAATEVMCPDCGNVFETCDHNTTDGTMPCKECGISENDFIAAARSWLDDHDGVEADDPGYF